MIQVTTQNINRTNIFRFKHSLLTGPPHTHTYIHVRAAVSGCSTDTLTLLHQPAIVWHDLALWEVEPHLQGNQHGKLQRYQLSSVDAETLLQLLFIQEKTRGCHQVMNSKEFSPIKYSTSTQSNKKVNNSQHRCQKPRIRPPARCWCVFQPPWGSQQGLLTVITWQAGAPAPYTQYWNLRLGASSCYSNHGSQVSV